MPYQSKLWQQYPPSTQTPQTAAALIAMETRAANYLGAVVIGPGVGSYADYLPTVAGGLSVTLAAGACGIALDTNGGVERYESAAAQTVVLATADPTNPRIDQIILVAPGTAASAGDSQTPTVQILAGTPTVGATLANRTGAQALPARSIRICDVLVTAGLVTLPQANVFDRRQQPYPGTMPMPPNASGLALVDQAPLVPHPLLDAALGLAVTPTFNNFQAACPVFLPRRIANVGHMRWAYVQSGTSLTGSYNWGLMDAGGTLLAATGAVALTGAASAFVQHNQAIALGTLEAGWYIAIMGWASLATGQLNYNGASLSNSATSPISAQGLAYQRTSGGTAIPTNLSIGALTDQYNLGLGTLPPMPNVVLTV